ncbi:MAG TPA: universal stress protein [Burkholderiales bacterium]|nr:universal stress protein [Burkholderiales bacterium]
MSYKTIVVHLDAAARRAERLEIACTLAAGFDAHLVGLFALASLPVPFAFGGNAGTVLASEQSWREKAAAEAQHEFERVVARHGVKAEWRDAPEDAVAAVRLSARYADLVVVGQDDGEASLREARIAERFAEEVVLTAGRPVLLVPYVGHFSTIGARVLVAWNAGQDAARALSDALPLLQRARSVEVVAFDPEPSATGHGPRPGAGIALYLARHGVQATAAQQHASIDVGNQILSRAADSDADLIVMGAYGHSRARELVLGGATRTVLESMTVPVLMSH